MEFGGAEGRADGARSLRACGTTPRLGGLAGRLFAPGLGDPLEAQEGQSLGRAFAQGRWQGLHGTSDLLRRLMLLANRITVRGWSARPFIVCSLLFLCVWA